MFISVRYCSSLGTPAVRLVPSFSALIFRSGLMRNSYGFRWLFSLGREFSLARLQGNSVCDWNDVYGSRTSIGKEIRTKPRSASLCEVVPLSSCHCFCK